MSKEKQQPPRKRNLEDEINFPEQQTRFDPEVRCVCKEGFSETVGAIFPLVYDAALGKEAKNTALSPAPIVGAVPDTLASG